MDFVLGCVVGAVFTIGVVYAAYQEARQQDLKEIDNKVAVKMRQRLIEEIKEKRNGRR